MEIPSLLSIASVCLVLFVIRIAAKYFIRPYYLLQQLKKVKGGILSYRPIFGNFPELIKSERIHKDALYVMKKNVQENPDLRFVASTFMSELYISLYDPELIKEFLNKQTLFVEKDLRIFGTITKTSKAGLVFSEGERWKSLRKLISQVFHFDYMNSSIPIISRTANEWVERFCTGPVSTVNVSKELKTYTATVIWRIFFGEESIDEKEESAKIIQTALESFRMTMTQSRSRWNFIFGPKFFKLGLRKFDRDFKRKYNWLLNVYTAKLKRFRQSIAEKHKKQGQADKHKNLVELLIEQSEKEMNGAGFSDLDIISQISTFFTAGTDTTSELLTISHYHLAMNQDIQEKIREEIKMHIGEAEITYEHFAKMDYLNAFVKEALRMHGPSVGVFPRVAKRDEMIGDIKIKKGFSVNVATVGLNYNPKFFKEPERFRPERWLEKEDAGVRNPLAYLPFSAGPRRCIGEQLALIEAKILLSNVIRNFKIDIQKPYELVMGIGLGYSARNPIHAVYTRIEKN